VYTTDDDTNLSSRMIEDVIQRQQSGATMKLYIDRVVSSGTVNDTTSRSITVPVILTSASLTVNPDDGQSVQIAFRPSEAPTFDLSKS
jgi:P pilus assembly chaperone PapD